MRKLKIDQSKLERAFDSGSDMISYYLDLETGEVINISDEERSLLESIYESYYDEQSETEVRPGFTLAKNAVRGAAAGCGRTCAAPGCGHSALLPAR
jgi:hypothetical protein